METIVLKTSSGEKNIYIGKDVTKARLPLLTQGQKNFVVTDSNVYSLYKTWFCQYFPETEICILPAGEKNKNMQSLCAILEKMAGAGMHRNSRLFAVGGGVIGDIGGLAAALYMRGISYIQIPTTLLAQVDSSVGGKTAVDFGDVKNLVGVFYQPEEVLIDSTFLSTLPDRELKCGLGEIVKYAALNGEIFDALEKGEGRWAELSFLETFLYDCVRHKAHVVEMDEKETGERRCLNIGHTTGHALELISGLSHGECVLYGMYYETLMAMELGVCDREYGERLIRLIKTAITLSPNEGLGKINLIACAEKARTDKKNTDDGLIIMSFAKAKNEWMAMAVPFEKYVEMLTKFM